jgi:hypothetical protein
MNSKSKLKDVKDCLRALPVDVAIQILKDILEDLDKLEKEKGKEK